MKLKKKSLTINSLAYILLFGTLATVGFLSFAGMLVIPYVNVGIIGAAVAATCAVAVEGEVYRQYIKKAMKKIFADNFFQQRLVERELKKLIADKKLVEQSKFLSHYQAQLKYLAKLKALNATSAQIKSAEKRLKSMQKFFSLIALNNEFNQATLAEWGLEEIVNAAYCEKLQAKLATQIKLNRIMIGFHGIAGIACTFTSIFSIHSGLLLLAGGIALSPTLMFGGIVPLGVLAGIGYSLIMYHCVADMIANETVQNLFKYLRKVFDYKNNPNKLKFVVKVIVIGLVTAIAAGLAFFATFATAGTWWIAAKNGALLIPYVAKAAMWIRNVVVPGMTISTLLFNLKNSFETLKKLDQFSLRRKIKQGMTELKAIKKKESWLEFLNPFRLIIKVIELPFDFLMFMGHLIGMGVMADGVKGVSKGITVGAGCTNEALIDAHVFMEEDHEHHHDHAKKGKTEKNKKHHHHHHDDEEHDHHHGTLMMNLLKLALSPLYICSALWAYTSCRASNFFATLLGLPGTGKAENQLSFLGQLKKTFGHEEKKEVTIDKPNISNQWKYQEAMLKVNKKLNNADKKDYQAMLQIKQSLDSMKPVANSSPEMITIKDILSKHRPVESKKAAQNNCFFAAKKTDKVEKFINKMTKNDEYAIPVCAR